MKRVFLLASSLKATIILLLLFACLSGLATFIESKFSTPSAWALIYANPIFALIQLLLGLNLFLAIFRYKMATKLPTFIFHVSFLFILFGSVMTRYFGFEGLLHLREGEESSRISSSMSYVKLASLGLNEEVHKKTLSKYISNIDVLGVNSFKLSLDLENKESALLRYKALITHAKEKAVESSTGPAFAQIALSSSRGSLPIKLQQGQGQALMDLAFRFLSGGEEAKAGAMNLKLENGNFYFLSSGRELPFLKPRTLEKGVLEASTWLLLDPNEVIVFEYGVFSFSFSALIKKASFIYESSDDLVAPNAVLAELCFQNICQDLYLFEGANPASVMINERKFFASFGKEEFLLPFSVHLNDFLLDRYEGSNSPKSYASDISVKADDFKTIISMNNVLDYKGFRFFQSSYDKDELGSILSVNKDPGKVPTYAGYFLLILGLLLNILSPKGRFATLSKRLNKDAMAGLFLCTLLFGFNAQNAMAQDLAATSDKQLVSSEAAKTTTSSEQKQPTPVEIEPLKAIAPVMTRLKSDAALREALRAHAKELDTLIVQTANGRLAPFATQSLQILEKVRKSKSYDELTPSEVLILLMSDFEHFAYEPLIYVENKELRESLGLQGKYASFFSFLKPDGYVLANDLDKALRTSPNNRNSRQKDLIKLDERVNIIYVAGSAGFLRGFTLEKDNLVHWLSPVEFEQIDEAHGENEDIKTTKLLYRGYLASLRSALDSGDFKLANLALAKIKEVQKLGSRDEGRIKAELFMNKADIFKRLMPIYLLAGFLLLALVFSKILKPNLNLKPAFRALYWLNVLCFVIHSSALALRGFVSGHAPWSNGYESMIYIAFALSLSGIIFSRKSPVSLALSSMLAGIMLFGAHLSNMDPQVTNLAPVLDSYWLTIHVSVITASYGFLGLCALLGGFSLLLFCFFGKNEALNERLAYNITQASRINEMSLILGLSMLTIGNFLGGIWANESWGRYWGWDSKETWSLVSILLYAAIVHTRFIPRLSNTYALAVESFFAYWVILMTYFGVNYFLTGLHSYAASSEPASIPNSVYITLAIQLLLFLASLRGRGFKRNLA